MIKSEAQTSDFIAGDVDIEALVRKASFLDELHELPNDEEFVRAYRDLVEEFRESPIGSLRIEEIINSQIINSSSGPQIAWLRYVQTLCGTPDYKFATPIPDSISQLFDSIVFSPAFFHATTTLLQEIESTTTALRSINFGSIKLERVVETYLLRLIDISQYVLYLDCIRAQTNYNKWSEGFSKLREASP